MEVNNCRSGIEHGWHQGAGQNCPRDSLAGKLEGQIRP